MPALIDLRIKSMFFDRQAVVQAMDKTKRQALSRGAAFIRQRAKSSIRKRKGISQSGQPPHSHEGSLRRLILFGYDRITDSVVVGPEGFRGSTAPNVLEFGGTGVIIRRRRGRTTKGRARFRSRPFMGPALMKELPHLPKLWANSLRGV